MHLYSSYPPRPTFLPPQSEKSETTVMVKNTKNKLTNCNESPKSILDFPSSSLVELTLNLASTKLSNELESLTNAASPSPRPSPHPRIYSQSSKFTGYSLWITPSNVSRTKLQRIINSTSLKSNTPSFQPHITLLASLTSPLDQLKRNLYTFKNHLRTLKFKDRMVDTKFSKLNCQPLFYKSLYSVPEDPKKFEELNKLASKLFTSYNEETESGDDNGNGNGNGCGYEGAYAPHLSLLYGNLEAEVKMGVYYDLMNSCLMNNKTRTRNNMNSDDDENESDTDSDSSSDSIVGGSGRTGCVFEFGRIELWKTEGGVENWSVVEGFDI